MGLVLWLLSLNLGSNCSLPDRIDRVNTMSAGMRRSCENGSDRRTSVKCIGVALLMFFLRTLGEVTPNACVPRCLAKAEETARHEKTQLSTQNKLRVELLGSSLTPQP